MRDGQMRDAPARAMPPTWPPARIARTRADNLPNRDCHALASNGELCCQYAPGGTCVMEAADPSCADGLRRYERHCALPLLEREAMPREHLLRSSL